MALVEGYEIGGCRILRKIGAGGMGEVYLAEQLRVGNRLVAVKIVNPEDHTFDTEIADDLKRRFEREAALLGRLSHPNILPVHDSGVQDDMLYLVMEYVPDGSMADAIRGTAKHPLKLPASTPFTVSVIGQLGDALQFVHDHGVVHRDVKPGNVLVRVQPDGSWKVLLADFGVARDLETSSARTQVTGTFAFMAPEQFSGSFSAASDQYALGVLTFLLLGGRTPFEGDLAALTKAHMFDAPPSLHKLNLAVPVEIESVVARAMAKDPADRWPSVAAFVDALRAAANGDAMATRPVTGAAAGFAGDRSTARMPASAAAGSRGQGRGQLRLLITALTAVLLVAAAGGGTFLVHQQQDQQNALATQTAQAALTATANVTPTATQIATLPQCAPGTTLQETEDATCVPPPPVSVGSPLLNATAPTCDASGTSWTASSDTTKTCDGQASVTLTTSSSASLACIEDFGVSSGDGYASVYVGNGTGDPVIGIRQAQVAQGNNGFIVTGYYFKVDPQAGQYLFYKIDSSGQPGTGTLHSLQGPLAAHFVLGVLYQGDSFTFYVNGVDVGNATDATYTTGGFGLCVDHQNAATQGSATYRTAQVFPLAG